MVTGSRAFEPQPARARMEGGREGGRLKKAAAIPQCKKKKKERKGGRMESLDKTCGQQSKSGLVWQALPARCKTSKSHARCSKRREGQGREGQGGEGQGRAGQGRAGQGRAGQGRGVWLSLSTDRFVYLSIYASLSLCRRRRRQVLSALEFGFGGCKAGKTRLHGSEDGLSEPAARTSWHSEL